MPKETQADKILQVLREHNGEWVNGRYFLQTMLISQYHARIWDLQRKGHVIQASPQTDQYGFKSYRLVSEALPMRQSPSSPQFCCPSREMLGICSRECEDKKKAIQNETLKVGQLQI